MTDSRLKQIIGAMKRTKPKDVRKASTIPVRVSAKEKATLERAAQRLGLATSAWLRMLGLETARAQPRDAATKE